MRLFLHALLAAALTVAGWSIAEAGHVGGNHSLHRSVVRIDDGAKFGAGVIVDHQTVLTATHVVARAAFAGTEVRLSGYDGANGTGTVIWYSNSLDLALVRITPGANLGSAAPIGCNRLRVGEALTLTGHPLGYGWSQMPGTVMSAIDDPRLDLRLSENEPHRAYGVLVAAPVQGGMSGGPAYDSAGRVRGILSRCVGAGYGPCQGWAILAGPQTICEVLGNK